MFVLYSLGNPKKYGISAFISYPLPLNTVPMLTQFGRRLAVPPFKERQFSHVSKLETGKKTCPHVAIVSPLTGAYKPAIDDFSVPA